MKNTKEYQDIINLLSKIDTELSDKIQHIPAQSYPIDEDGQSFRFEWAFESVTERNSVYRNRKSYG